MKKQRILKRMVWREILSVTFCCIFTTMAAVALPAKAQAPVCFDDKKTIICIDPGHGGETDGATYSYDGVAVYEKDLNLQIALKLEEELLKYENIEVVITRREDITLGLKERVQIASDQNADYLISIHNNAPANPEGNPRGCMVLVTRSHYQPEESRVPDIYDISSQLGLSIVGKLQNLGLLLGNELGADSNNGLVQRPYSPDGGAKSTYYYPDGSVTDYYAIIRYGVQAGIPSVIIEHAYLSNEEEYREFLATEEALEELAKADAQGIAEALHLEYIE